MRSVRFHYAGEDYLNAVESTFSQNEALHSLAYGLARRFAGEAVRPGNAGDPRRPQGKEPPDDSHLMTVWDGERLDLAVWHTPPRAFNVTGGPHEGLRELAAWMKESNIVPDELNGPTAAIDVLAEALGWPVESVMDLALFELAEVRFPEHATPIDLTIADPANRADRSVALEWTHRFAVDCGLEDETTPVERDLPHLESGSLYFARDPSGQPVSMVAITRSTSRTANLSYVYTPDPLRGRGYASATVAALSQHLLANGKERCTLFTDLANPTSNRIYEGLGYGRIETFRRVRVRGGGHGARNAQLGPMA